PIMAAGAGGRSTAIWRIRSNNSSGDPANAVRAQAAQSLGIILHELATNASKYGPLSVLAGKIMIRWDFAPKSVQLSWRERDGPTVKAPAHPGLGRIIIERMAGDMFGGAAKLELLPTGIHCSASIPRSFIVGSSHRR